IESGVEGATEGKAANKTAGGERALQPVAEFQEAPPVQLAHVLLRQSRERSDDPQRSVDSLEHRTLFGNLLERAVDELDHFGKRPPRIRRETITNDRGGALRASRERRQSAGKLAILQYRRSETCRPRIQNI